MSGSHCYSSSWAECGPVRAWNVPVSLQPLQGGVFPISYREMVAPRFCLWPGNGPRLLPFGAAGIFPCPHFPTACPVPPGLCVCSLQGHPYYCCQPLTFRSSPPAPAIWESRDTPSAVPGPKPPLFSSVSSTTPRRQASVPLLLPRAPQRGWRVDPCE